jgi:hypothetical protein
VIEGGHCADDAAHHRHRMRVAAEATPELRHLLVNHRVIGHVIHEVGLLGLVRQLAVQDQIGDLEEVTLLGQVLDRVAAMQKDALVAVDIGDLRLAAAGRGVARIVGEVAGVVVELADVDDAGTDRTFDDRQLDGLAVGVGEGRDLVGAGRFGSHGHPPQS